MAEAGNNDDGDGRRKLPAQWDSLLEDRSKLFYDGTYEWNGSSGFWDDTGIYHEFNDPNDPEAHPPTPGPVGPFYESEYNEPELDTESMDELAAQESPANTSPCKGKQNLIDPDLETSLAKFLREAMATLLVKGDIHDEAILEDEDDLFAGYPNRERLLGQLEGILVGKWMSQNKLTFGDCYKLCGIKIPDALRANLDIRLADTRSSTTPGRFTESRAMGASEGDSLVECGIGGSSPLADENSDGIEKVAKDKDKANGPNPQEGIKNVDLKDGPSFNSSPLSDCPSDLSDWQVAEQDKGPNRRKHSVDSGIGELHQDNSREIMLTEHRHSD
ncbi:hypothetical protein N0V90_010278 [Kalmusia sp. IMI 367209]|nr:hypothetical protein N0V90_010278 [Kalmusia sp. IMI 367209]